MLICSQSVSERDNSAGDIWVTLPRSCFPFFFFNRTNGSFILTSALNNKLMYCTHTFKAVQLSLCVTDPCTFCSLPQSYRVSEAF